MTKEAAEKQPTQYKGTQGPHRLQKGQIVQGSTSIRLKIVGCRSAMVSAMQLETVSGEMEELELEAHHILLNDSNDEGETWAINLHPPNFQATSAEDISSSMLDLKCIRSACTTDPRSGSGFEPGTAFGPETETSAPDHHCTF
ncbi:hypothetical protein AVEN_180182-1 [Araneus ventricosus]|uniref:Uncharacterized protein n=1 Tax=Araneus ventricosus TaxID=182803 RepID=A0A4Y2UEP8_ARAVE|nr:hypothetical protein AVEN_180182-1 [Araneus ventricosus]